MLENIIYPGSQILWKKNDLVTGWEKRGTGPSVVIDIGGLPYHCGLLTMGKKSCASPVSRSCQNWLVLQWQICIGKGLLLQFADHIRFVRETELTFFVRFFSSIDHLVIQSVDPNKPPLKRVPEVFDCWFESGSMPYAQLHYPFEHKKEFPSLFPADFIAEGIDQTRGW